MVNKTAPSSILYPPSSDSACNRASFLSHMRLELVAKLADERARRPGSGIAERANRVARDIPGDVENQIQITFFAVTILNAVKNFLHPVAAFATWAALTA